MKGVPREPPKGGAKGATPLVKEIKPGEEITLEHLTSPGAASLAAEGESPFLSVALPMISPLSLSPPPCLFLLPPALRPLAGRSRPM